MDDGWVSWVLLSGANSLVREKKDINTDKQVQSQTQAVPTAGAPGVLRSRRSYQPVLQNFQEKGVI